MYGLVQALLVSALLGVLLVWLRSLETIPIWLGLAAFALIFLALAFPVVPLTFLLERRILGPLRRIGQADLALAEGEFSGPSSLDAPEFAEEFGSLLHNRRAVLRRLNLIDRIGRLAIEAAPAQGLESGVLTTLLEALQCETARLWLLDADGSTFVCRAEASLGEASSGTFVGQRLAASGEPLLEAMARQKGPVVIQNADDPQYRTLIGSQALAKSGYQSMIGVPLLREGELIGFVVIGTTGRARAFSVADVALARSAVNLTSVALNNARGRIVEREQAKRITGLAELAATLSTHHRLEEVLQEIVRRGAILTRSATCTVLLVDEPQHELVMWAQVGLEGNADVRVPLSVDLVSRFLQRGEPLIVEDIDHEMPELRRVLVRKDVRSISILPMKIGSRVIGALTLGRLHPYRPSAAEGSVSEALASVAAAAIQNARAFEGEVEQRNLLATVAEISRKVSGILETDEMLRQVCNLMGDALSFEHVHVFLFFEPDSVLRYAAGSGRVGVEIANREVELPVDSTTFVGRVAELGEALHEAEAVHDAFHQSHPALRAVASQSGQPIVAHERVIGVLNVQSSRPRPFDAQVEQLLRVVAEQIAVALDNARHHAEVQRQAQLDSLTEVLNHGAFVAALHELVVQSRKEEIPLSLIMLDVDTFKSYNDRFGHVAGDAALRTTVQAIRAHVKRRDAIGRWGGEEFGIVLVGANKDQAGQVAKRIQVTLASLEPIDDLGRKMPAPTVSQGIATLDEDAATANELVDVADQALYRAKDAGRNQVRFAGAM